MACQQVLPAISSDRCGRKDLGKRIVGTHAVPVSQEKDPPREGLEDRLEEERSDRDRPRDGDSQDLIAPEAPAKKRLDSVTWISNW
jgi:hypothetical protein